VTRAGGRIAVELVKFATSRPLWALPVVTIGLTWALTYVSGLSEVVATGGDLEGATSANNPMLYSDQPLPLEYQGFDMMNLGLVLMIALGALYAGHEYRSGLMRSSLLADPRRLGLFVTKVAVLTAVVTSTALVSMGVGTMIRHAALGEFGLDPFALPPIVWRCVAGVALVWSVVAVMAFSIGMCARGAIAPLIALLPLAVGLGDFLGTLWPPLRFLPPTAGLSLFSPADTVHLSAGAGALVMVAWAAVTGCVAAWVFRRRDV
jgi:ABC-2 type transport system permease protein